MTVIATFCVGMLLGMWVGKHPEDARAYGEAAAVRAKLAFRWVLRRFKKDSPAEPPT
jgi:hypothetical protein